MPVPDVENGLQLLREKLEYMRFEMTVLERGNGLVADLAMTVAGFVGTAVDAARGWLRRES